MIDFIKWYEDKAEVWERRFYIYICLKEKKMFFYVRGLKEFV